MKKTAVFIVLFVLAGSSPCPAFLGFEGKPKAPPEYSQKILLEVNDEPKVHQAQRSGYDIGDLQAFHDQVALPMLVEDSFKEIFGQVEMVPKGADIETTPPDVPAIFEVHMIDSAHDYFDGGQDYRAQVTLAVAMKSPRGNIFWQQAFRGEGYVRADQTLQANMGPAEAANDAVRDAINQMQNAILKSPEVLNQMRYYAQIDKARSEKEVKI
ncbi:MAG TPA: hypothetical protein VJC08_05560 [bacterium]|nr:hypothetical protein [bacterium]